MLKALLCPITGNPADRSALDTAARIARRFAAHVEVLHIKPDASDMIPYLGDGMAPDVINQVIEKSERRADEQAAAARATFSRWSRECDLPEMTAPTVSDSPSSAWRQENGTEDRWIAQLGRLADVVILPAVRNDAAVGATLAFEAALLDTGRPVILAPPQSLDVSGVSVVAWNGSPESARAITAALPLLAAAREVHVVTIEERNRAADPAAVAGYLAWHRIDARVHRIATSDIAVSTEIDAACVAHGAGLLVMGGYTHSRLRELLFGGVTAHVAKAPRIPVLLAH